MKNQCHRIARAIAVLVAASAMPAYSLAGNNGCAFNASGTTGLAFPTLDPSSGALVTANATVQVGDCPSGQTMLVTVDQGQRMNRTMIRVGGTELIPYSVSTPTFSPGNASGPGNGLYKTATFTGTVQASAYADAVAGNYSDVLTVTVSP